MKSASIPILHQLVCTHLVVLKATHVAVCSNTVRTQEVGTVAAASESFLTCLAARTHNLHVVYRQHIKDLNEDVVKWQ